MNDRPVGLTAAVSELLTLSVLSWWPVIMPVVEGTAVVIQRFAINLHDPLQKKCDAACVDQPALEDTS